VRSSREGLAERSSVLGGVLSLFSLYSLLDNNESREVLSMVERGDLVGDLGVGEVERWVSISLKIYVAPFHAQLSRWFPAFISSGSGLKVQASSACTGSSLEMNGEWTSLSSALVLNGDRMLLRFTSRSREGLDEFKFIEDEFVGGLERRFRLR